MKRILLVMAIALFCSLSIFAQNTDKPETKENRFTHGLAVTTRWRQ